jgi:hypothetical protein
MKKILRPVLGLLLTLVFTVSFLSPSTAYGAGEKIFGRYRTELNWQLPTETQTKINYFVLVIDGTIAYRQIPNQNTQNPNYQLDITDSNNYFLSFYYNFNPGDHTWQLFGYSQNDSLVLQTPVQTLPIEQVFDWQMLWTMIKNAFRDNWQMMLSVVIALGTLLFLVFFGLFFVLDLIFSKGLSTLVKFGARDKLKLQKTGFIYDTKTSIGVPFALVTLEGRDAQGRSIIITSVSDVHGIYNAIVAPLGNYTLSVKKNGYAFPTRKTKPSVLPHDVFYKGEAITVANQWTTISPTVPVDPYVLGETKKKLRSSLSDRFWQGWKNLAKKQVYFEIALFFFSIIGSILEHNLVFIVLTIIYALFLFRRFVFILKPANLVGRVVDENNHGLMHAVVEIYQNDEEHAFRTMAVTDKNGRFAFRLRPGEYAITAHKNGYLGQSEGRAVNVDEHLQISRQRQKKIIKLTPIPHLKEDFFFTPTPTAKPNPAPADAAPPTPPTDPPPPQS